jgi:hypothetical protein
MRGTKLNIDSYFSRVIHIHNFPTILLAGSLDRKKKQHESWKNKEENQEPKLFFVSHATGPA